MLNQHTIDLAKILWDYHKIDQKVEKSDLIFGLGSIDIRTADRSAELFKQGFAPKILFSGGIAHADDMLRTTWSEPEAEVFKQRAVELGVPENSILAETRANNTGENITLGYDLIQKNKLKINSMILVQKPYMLRRTYATFMKQWPGEDIKIYVTCPQISFEDYILKEPENEQKKIINIMAGDLHRIIEYPKLGFQIEQEVPENVLEAFNELISVGYDKHLIK